jgi:hypothetical protein
MRPGFIGTDGQARRGGQTGEARRGTDEDIQGFWQMCRQKP